MELEELRRQLIAGTLGVLKPPPRPESIWYNLKHLTAPYCYNHDPLTPGAHKARFRIDSTGTKISFPVGLGTGRLLGSMYNGQHTIKITHGSSKEDITASVLMVWPCHKPGIEGTDIKPTPAHETCYFIEAEVMKIEVHKVRFKALQEVSAGLRGVGQFMLSKGQVIEITDGDIVEAIRHELVRTGKVIEYGP